MSRVVLLGSCLPRQCGIATFSADLARTLSALDPLLTVDSVAMSDRVGYAYPEHVRHEIAEADRASYAPAAEHINRAGYDVLSVQHEYGIFGGDSGSYLMDLLREAKMPFVTTLHTVLRDPTPSQKQVMDELLQLSERVVVMSRKAVEFLVEVHGLSPEKIDFIPHGIPDIQGADAAEFRSKLNIDGPFILTFGLLSPDKGIQYVIQAMPRIILDHPGATYVVVGATHPNIRASAGEAYRDSLEKLVVDLGLEAHVRFVDRFVESDELVKYLAAMDVYVTPYLNPKQITSGTLAYSVGAGKAVISTPYWYAEELLAEGRGLLVPFRDADAIADAVLAIQSAPEDRSEMGRRAAEFGRKMLWPEVGKCYLESFAKAKRDSAERLRVLVQTPAAANSSATALPEVRLDHLVELSDDTGILQHATFTIPNRSEGYCVDDNARALLLTSYLEGLAPLSTQVSLLQSRYLSFVLDAFNPATGRFRNFMSYPRQWLEDSGSEDSHGRSLWALGAIAARCRSRARRDVAKSLFEKAGPALLTTTSPRTWSYGALAADEFLQAYPGDSTAQFLRQTMAERLLHAYECNQDIGWRWFEQSLTYANPRLSQALIVSGKAVGDQSMLDVGLVSLKWLMSVQTGPSGVFAPIGTNGFFVRNANRSHYDQQPVEASSAASACLSAFRATGSEAWHREAMRAFRWFHGENTVGHPVYESATGGCHDGLHSHGVNRNQGAESTLSYLCALADLLLQTEKPVQITHARLSSHEVQRTRSAPRKAPHQSDPDGG